MCAGFEQILQMQSLRKQL